MRKAKSVCLQMMSTSFTWFLFGSLLIGVKGVTVNVAVNGRVTLPCIVPDHGDNTVKWYKNPNTMLSMALFVMPAFKKRMSIFQPYNGEWNLHIAHVQLGDTGDYSCRVGDDVVEQVDLIVETPPMIHVTPDMTFQEGDTGSLWCNASGSPTPVIRWFLKSPLQNDGLGRDSGAEGNRLVLHNITRYYDNIYVCSASNNAGTESRDIRIHVNFAPEVEAFQDTITATLGEEVTLHCAVAAYPMDGEVEWVFQSNNLPINANWKYEVVTNREMEKDYNTIFASLTIRKGHLGEGDYGHYVCRTKNFSWGHSQKEFIIQKSIEQEEDGISHYIT